jgi:hypothetical protein
LEKIEGLLCKICKTGTRVDFEKNRGAFLQNGGGILARNYFSTDKFMDRVHVSVDRPACSVHHGVPKLDGGGAKGREEHQELGSGLTGARAAL